MNSTKIIKSLILILISGALLAIPRPPDLGIGSYILYEPSTKKVIVSFNENESVEPASLTKLMTSYVVADYIKDEFISLEDDPRISIKAWQTPGSKMFIREGTKVKVSDLIKGMIIQSGNDASVALAEHIAGSEENFVYLMNEYAIELGMKNSNFNNVTGLPDPENITSALDLAILTSAIIEDFPDHYKIYSEKSFTYGGITQGSRNRLLWRDEIFDGGKTGYTKNAGYCLVGAAKRDDMRLIAVVLGSENDKRFNDVTLLMNYGFKYFSKEKRIIKDQPLKSLKVVAGVEDEVLVGPSNDVVLTLPKDIELEYTLTLPDQVLAPILKGDIVGSVKAVDSEGNVLAEEDLIYLSSVEELGFFERLFEIIWNWILSLFS
tara:strand:+ start:2194 stop:3327 length:1134 start_codon:yes stop_codon:yes gene_type:complete